MAPEPEQLRGPLSLMRFVAFVLILLALVGTTIGIVLTSTGTSAAHNPGSQISSTTGLPHKVAFFWDTGTRPRSLVPLDQIIEGGPPPDGIPSIDHPSFERASQAHWLDAQEPVLSVEVAGETRGYPLQILLWHEIVNDTIAGVPIVVTYCPLCNSSIVYERTIRGVPVTFGTSGRLYYSDLVMYDRATQSLWVQFLGKAIVGPLIGTNLTEVSSTIVSFGEFKAAHPGSRMLSRRTGFDRPYGSTPYVGYDTNPHPFLFSGRADPRLSAIARVVGVEIGGAAKAYPVSSLRTLGDPAVVDDRVATEDIVMMFKSGLKSPLDAELILDSRDIGESGVFSRTIDGRDLTFGRSGSSVVDIETGTHWDILGRAISGPLAGEALVPVRKVDTFWFAWSVFLPRATLWGPK